MREENYTMSACASKSTLSLRDQHLEETLYFLATAWYIPTKFERILLK